MRNFSAPFVHFPNHVLGRSESGAKANGFTLIELMVTLAVLAILLFMAAPSFIEWRMNTQLVAQTNHVINALGVARSEALKRNSAVDLEFIKTGDVVSAWRIYEDKDFDGKFTEPSDDLILQTEALPEAIELISGRNKIRYDGSGFARGAATTTIKLGYMDNDSKQLKAARHVVVNNTGRVRSCKPASLDGVTELADTPSC